MSNASLTLRALVRSALALGLTIASAAQSGCSGTAPNTGGGGSAGVGGAAGSGAMGGSTSAGGASASGGTGGVCSGRPSSCFPLCEGGLCDCYCPGTGGAGAGTGGRPSTGGSSGTSPGGVCGTNCRLESLTGAFCGTSPSLVCTGPFPSNLNAIMTANGCTDAYTDAVRYCCPALILTQCQ